MSTKTLPVSVRISRPMQLARHNCSIEISDEVSGCRIVTVSLPFDALARLILGHGQEEATAEYRLDNLGKTREIKHEDVSWDYSGKATKAEALAPFEVDGWSGDKTCLGNHHKYVDYKTSTFRVSFVRWV